MFGLGALLEALIGPLFRVVTVPLIALSAFTFGHMWWEQKKETLRIQGEQRCDARWEEKIRGEERKAAEQEIAATRLLFEAERKTNDGLNQELDRITKEVDQLRAGRDFGRDSNCLSDGVLNELRRRQPNSGPVKPKSKESGPAGPAS